MPFAAVDSDLHNNTSRLNHMVITPVPNPIRFSEVLRMADRQLLFRNAGRAYSQKCEPGTRAKLNVTAAVPCDDDKLHLGALSTVDRGQVDGDATYFAETALYSAVLSRTLMEWCARGRRGHQIPVGSWLMGFSSILHQLRCKIIDVSYLRGNRRRRQPPYLPPPRSGVAGDVYDRGRL